MAKLSTIQESVQAFQLSNELLSTKLVPSYISGTLLRRGRLLAKIASNPNAKLILIHGAAGSGKSSLLYDYITHQGVPIAWYSIHESDRDLKVFLAYIYATLMKHYPLTAQNIPVPQKMAFPEQEWKHFLTLLINAMVEYKKKIILVLDDYHLLKDSQPITEILEYLLLNAPSNFSCFMATRINPKLPLAYLQSKEALVLLRPNDLSLDLTELKQLFNNVWNIPMSEKVIALIHAKTEGWFAAARLISQAIFGKSMTEIEQYINKLNLKEDLIYDYLAKEVYLRQQKIIKDFLKYSSILTSFNCDLAEFVTQLPNAKEKLDQLEQSELFVIHLDNEEEWFRYHHLFSDFLRSLLKQENDKLFINDLHSRAAKWHEQHNNIADAIEHYLHAEQNQEVVRLLIQEGQKLFQNGLLSLLHKWLSLIPKKTKELFSELMLLEGEVYDIMGHWDKAVSSYEKAWMLLKSEQNISKIPVVLERLILCLIKYGEYSKIFNYCHQALEICTYDNKGLRSRLLSWLGMAHVVYGDDKWIKAYDMLKEGYTLAYESGDPEAIASSCISYGFMYHFPQGNFTEAQRVFGEGATLLKRLGFPFLACHQIMNKAVAQIFNGMLEEAHNTIEEAAQMATEYNIHFVKQALFVTQVILNLEQKDFKKLKLNLAVLIAQEIPLQLRPWHYRSVALLHLLEGNLEQAMVASNEMLCQLQLVGKGMYAPECYIVTGLIYWKKHMHYKARKWFMDALAAAERGKMKLWVMKSHYYLAALYSSLKNASFEFREHYQMAIKLSQENNYWSVWSTDLFDLTVPLLMAAFKLEIELIETKKIIEMVKPKVLKTIESLLSCGTNSQRSLACNLLASIDDINAKLLLKMAQKDPTQKIRNKANAALVSSRSVATAIFITTLGTFSVTQNLSCILPKEWQRKKALKLFKYFLVAFPKEVIADQLLEIFWPHLPLKEAKHNLAVHLTYIRKVLNPSGPRCDESFIEGGSDRFRLKLREQDHFDVIAFLNYYQKSKDSLKEQNWKLAIQSFKEIQKLYQGEFLESDPYEEWILTCREELQQKYLSVLEQIACYYESQKEFQEALTYYRLYLKTQPIQEKIVCAVIRCLAALGDLASVKQEYAKFKTSVKRQLAQKPSLNIETLIKQVIPYV